MSDTQRRASSPTAVPLWMLFPLFFVAVFLSHLTLLRLPYFWDEGGYYIPAAWDLFRTGTLIPQSTITNAHPPLPSILLAGWWHLSGFVIIGTRTLVCMVAAAALLAVYRIARNLTSPAVATVAVVLTGLYPVWFAQSTLAHADIFAAAFTLWALSFYLEAKQAEPVASPSLFPTYLWTVTLFSFAALSKETAIVTPVALAILEAVCMLRTRGIKRLRRAHLTWAGTLLLPILPLAAWYAYHYTRTGFVFGNPEFLRYNATANLTLYRVLLCLWHRLLHLTTHMNMFVPTLCMIAAFIFSSRTKAPTETPSRIARPALYAIVVVLSANWLAYSVLGGALLTRYLLPLYPLILILFLETWHQRLKSYWLPFSALTAAAFLCGLWINPPYAFAPEDNLTYRDMIVLHQQAIRVIAKQFPQATVLTAWPATSELTRPEIGYTRIPFKVFPVQNFSLEQMQLAATDPGSYDTALIFSTKWEPRVDLGKPNRSADTKYFDFHHDLRPAEAAALLHGQVVWQSQRNGEWAAVLHFPRVINARLVPSARIVLDGSLKLNLISQP